MSLNPNKLFIIHALSRASIAENCNDCIDGLELKNAGTVADDDDRLTDALCEQYTKMLSEHYDGESQEDENSENAVLWLLDQIGIDTKEEKPEISEEKRREITEAKLAIIRLQARINVLEEN